MKNITILIIAFLISFPVYAKDYAMRYPTGTAVEIYNSSNPPPGSMVYPGAGIPVSTGTTWGASITDNSSNWNTAYGWGNHADAGYLTEESDPIYVAWDKDYDDLSNKPAIPDELADLSDDADHRLVTDTEKSTWDGKQDALNGTGFVKMTGVTVSYDNATYLTSYTETDPLSINLNQSPAQQFTDGAMTGSGFLHATQGIVDIRSHGVTDSGAGCTITEIIDGIITGATC